MKKCVLSAAVLALLVPAVYAMDGAAEPVVEVEVPAVETPVEVEVEVTVASEEAPVTDDVKVEVEAVEVDPAVLNVLPVEGEVPEVVVCELHPTDMVEKIATDDMFECPVIGGEAGPLIYARGGEGEVPDGGGEPIMYMFGAPAVEGGEPVAVEGEAVDPNLVDLASQSGVANEALGVGEVEVTAVEDTPTRGGEGEIQPHFRNLSAGPTGGGDVELMSASTGGVASLESAEPQLLNDEQRGSIRGLRTEEESTKARSGLGKFMAKFRKPKSEVTQASATTTAKTDKALAGKLAEVDRMRDTALRTGDQKALAKADKLEKELRSKAGTATRIPTRTK